MSYINGTVAGFQGSASHPAVGQVSNESAPVITGSGTILGTDSRVTFLGTMTVQPAEWSFIYAVSRQTQNNKDYYVWSITTNGSATAVTGSGDLQIVFDLNGLANASINVANIEFSFGQAFLVENGVVGQCDTLTFAPTVMSQNLGVFQLGRPMPVTVVPFTFGTIELKETVTK